jgi:hypothetical protein
MLPTDHRGLSDWLLGVSRAGLRDLAWILDRPVDTEAGALVMRSFADEAGDRRPVDPLLLGQVLGTAPPVEIAAACKARADEDPALKLWLAVTCGGQPDPAMLASTGPLFPHLREQGIEAWTEAELSGVHALSLLGRSCAARVRSSAAWLIAEMQPDNGTNRPWGTHVFLDLWLKEAHAEARLYAESLVHNCRVTLGVPDRFSAVILASTGMALASGGSR